MSYRDMVRVPRHGDEGVEWLYWDPPARRWRHVELLVVPSDDPKRVRVQHLDSNQGGRAEWVPSRRLHVYWADRDEYLADRERWERLERHGPETVVATDLAVVVLAQYVDETVAEMADTGPTGVMRVGSLAELASRCGLSELDITAHEDSIRDGAVWFIPWPKTRLIIEGMCRGDPAPALRMLEKELRDLRGLDEIVAEEGERWWMNPEPEYARDARIVQRWHEGDLERVRVLREWLSVDAPGLAESYLELQRMYYELIAAAKEAVPRVRMVRSQISERIASRLETLIERPTPIVSLQGEHRRSDL